MGRRGKKGTHKLPRKVVERRPMWACPLHKKLAYSYKAATKVANRLDGPAHTYWCPAAGGYHVTGAEPGEYDRRVQEYLQRNDEEGKR